MSDEQGERRGWRAALGSIPARRRILYFWSLVGGLAATIFTAGVLEAQTSSYVYQPNPVLKQSVQMYLAARVDASVTTPATYASVGRCFWDTVNDCLACYHADGGIKCTGRSIGPRDGGLWAFAIADAGVPYEYPIPYSETQAVVIGEAPRDPFAQLDVANDDGAVWEDQPCDTEGCATPPAWSVGTPFGISITAANPSGAGDPTLLLRMEGDPGDYYVTGAIGTTASPTAAWGSGFASGRLADMYFLTRDASDHLVERVRFSGDGDTKVTINPQGTVGTSTLSVRGGVAVGSYYSGTAASSGNVILSGALGVGVAAPSVKGAFAGAVNVGSTYGAMSGVSDGLMVEGNAAFGTTSAATRIAAVGAVHAYDSGGTPDNTYPGTIRSTRAASNTGQHVQLTRQGTRCWGLGYEHNASSFALGQCQATDSSFDAANANILVTTAGLVRVRDDLDVIDDLTVFDDAVVKGGLSVEQETSLGSFASFSTSTTTLYGLAIAANKADPDPSGTNGAWYYNTTSNKFRCYENSAWTDCITTGGGAGTISGGPPDHAGNVAFWTSSTAIDGVDGLHFDSSNIRLSIGAGTTPSYTLDVLTAAGASEVNAQLKVSDASGDWMRLGNATSVAAQYIAEVSGTHTTDNRAGLSLISLGADATCTTCSGGGGGSILWPGVLITAETTGNVAWATRPIASFTAHNDVAATVWPGGRLRIEAGESVITTNRVSPGAKIGVYGTGASDDPSTGSSSTRAIHATMAGQTDLTVRDSTNDIEARLSALNSGFTQKVAFGAQTNHGVSFLTNNVEVMQIDNGGLVGINQAPATAVQLGITRTSSGATTVPLNILNGGSGNNTAVQLVLSNGSSDDVKITATSPSGNTNSSSTLQIQTRQSGGTYNTGAFFDASGNLTLGTTTAGLALEVVNAGATLSGNVKAIERVVQDQTTYRGVGIGYDSSAQVGVIYPESGGSASILDIYAYSGSAWGRTVRVNSTGVSIGSTTVTSLLNIGSSAQFRVDASGIIAAIGGLSGASGNYDWSGSSGTFKTATGAVTIGSGAVSITGDATMASGKALTMTAGRFLGAQGTDVASGTNITLSAGNFFQVTGTTTIDCIVGTSWQAGSVVTLRFSSTLTVTHAGSCSGANKQIRLAGSANFSATANDNLTFVYDGTTFDQIAGTVI